MVDIFDSVVAQPQSHPQAPVSPTSAPAPVSNSGDIFDSVAKEQAANSSTSTTGTNAPTAPSYLSQVEDHITNTAHAIWHGLSGTEASPVALMRGTAPSETAETASEKGSTPGFEFK